MRKNWKKFVGVLCLCGVLSSFPLTAYADINNEGSQTVETGLVEGGIKKTVVEDYDEDEDADEGEFSEAPRVLNQTSAARAQVDTEALAAEAKKQAEEAAAKLAWMRAEEESSESRALAVAAAENSKLRQKVVEYALSFVGGPYRYGGNDPRTGVDCSGFTRFVLSNAANIHISRTSVTQSSDGPAISDVQMRAGDLLFYSKGGRINHVAMYIGGGKVVHASNPKTGITVSNWNYRTPVKIVDVIGD